MFHPATPEDTETLLAVFLSIFLRNEMGRALFGVNLFMFFPLGCRGLWFDAPSFTNHLTLRLATAVKTQDQPGGTRDFNPTKRCLVADQLERHIKSTGQWTTVANWPPKPGNTSQTYLEWKVPARRGFKLYRLLPPDLYDCRWECCPDCIPTVRKKLAVSRDHNRPRPASIQVAQLICSQKRQEILDVNDADRSTFGYGVIAHVYAFYISVCPRPLT